MTFQQQWHGAYGGDRAVLLNGVAHDAPTSGASGARHECNALLTAQ